MSRRTHGLVALLAVAALVALVVWWRWPAGEDGATPGTLPSSPAPTSSVAPSPTGPAPSPTSTQTILPGATLAPCPRHGRAVPLTVVTFNIHSGIGHSGLDLDRIAGEIAAIEPDVVLLQEVDNRR